MGKGEIGEGLRIYQQAMRDAKADPLYRRYAKAYYGLSRLVRRSGGRVTAARSARLGPILGLGEFRRLSDLGYDPGSLAMGQFNLIDPASANRLADSLLDEAESNASFAQLVLKPGRAKKLRLGIGLIRDDLRWDVRAIMARALPKPVWDAMRITAEAKGLTVSQQFFGSL